MASGSEEPKAGSSDEAVSSPGPEEAAAPGAGDDEAAAPAVTALAATTRPYYECVFCKRGFTTAQALGGHMNIHRRDRGKPGRDTTTASTSVSSSRNVDSYNLYHHLAPPYPSAPPRATTTSMSTSSSTFAMFYRGTGAVTGLVDGEAVSPSSARPKELTLFGAAARDHDLRLGLGCHECGGGDGSRAAAEGSSERQAGEPERELDLELRLGRRPRH